MLHRNRIPRNFQNNTIYNSHNTQCSVLKNLADLSNFEMMFLEPKYYYFIVCGVVLQQQCSGIWSLKIRESLSYQPQRPKAQTLDT